jgi:hypothetical protein
MPNYDIHHKDGDPGNNEEANLLPLCRKCHRVLPKSTDRSNKDIIAVTFSSEYRQQLLKRAGNRCGLCSRPISDTLCENACIRCGKEIDITANPSGESGFCRYENGSMTCCQCNYGWLNESLRRSERGEYPADPITWRANAEGIKIPYWEKMTLPPIIPGEMRIYGQVG